MDENALSRQGQIELIQNIWKEYLDSPPTESVINEILLKAEESQRRDGGNEYKIGTFISWWTRSTLSRLIHESLEQRIENMRASIGMAKTAGGSLASEGLIESLELRDRVQGTHLPAEALDEAMAFLNQCIVDWREALVRHNAQDQAFARYDVETGKATQDKEPDHG